LIDRNVKRIKRRRGKKSKTGQFRGPRNFQNLRQEHVGRLFLLASRIFERAALEEWRQLGFDDLRLVHLALIRDLPVEGMRTTDIADSTGMTKQAVGQLAMELEELGYLLRLPDPTDGRAKLVCYAPRGQELVAIIPQVIMRAEAKIKSVVGTDDFIILRRALKQLVAGVGFTEPNLR
jgi:DNA-binding MarR family transcriptional regulator